MNGSSFSISSLLGGISKTLGIVNQALPIIKEMRPMVSNAKKLINIVTSINNNEDKNIVVNNKKEVSVSPTSNPVFFQ